MTDLTVRRVDFGCFVRPGTETDSGLPRVEPCLGYVVDHPEGLLLVDTGMGSHPDVDAHYRPRRRSLDDALAAAGARREDVRWVTNCHLHFDHCGGNPALGGRPIFVQRVELGTARERDDYTLPELVDFASAAYEVVEGETEILPSVLLMPTPGHTEGHQSVVVRKRDGTVVVAGQSHATAAAYGHDVLAWSAARDHQEAGLPDFPAWIPALQRFDPARVVFAHDASVWEP